jgi:hypothetical protein
MESEEIENLKKQAKVISEARIENMRGYDEMVQEKNSNFVSNAYKALYGKNKASNNQTHR